MLKKYAIILAAGSSSRLKAAAPKQFLTLNKEPVLFHTISAFKNYSKDIELIVVLQKEHISTYSELCKKYDFREKVAIVEGGATRFESVKKGLSCIKQKAVVAIHDGVRPFASKDLIKRCFIAAEEFGTAVPAITPIDSLRHGDKNHSKIAYREEFYLVQTPQCYLSDIILAAYQQSYDRRFTDDSAVVEKKGYSIRLIEGEQKNIKITTRLDMKIAQALVKK